MVTCVRNPLKLAQAKEFIGFDVGKILTTELSSVATARLGGFNNVINIPSAHPSFPLGWHPADLTIS